MAISIMVCLGLLISIAFHCYALRRRSMRLPPGPMALPIIGHLHLLGSLPHQSLANLAKKYGPLMYLRLGSVGTIVATSPEMATLILKTQGHVFVNRSRTAFSEILAYDSTSIAFSPYNPYWREARRVCVTQLFSPKKLEAFQNLRREESFQFMRSIWAAAGTSPGKPISLGPYLAAFAASNISRMAFRKAYACQAPVYNDNNNHQDGHAGGGEYISQHEYDSSGTEHFKAMIDEMFHLMSAFNFSDYIPWLRWLDIHGYNQRMTNLRKKIGDLLDRIVDEHVQQRQMRPHEDEADRDLVDVLLIASQNPDSKIRFTKDNIKAIGMDMFNGGVDTTMVSSEWAMAELMRKPEILMKLQREIDSVVGRQRRMDESDLSDLKYLQCVTKETIRLHPPGPLLIPHESVEDCMVAGYAIPAKTRALVNVWAIGRDPSVWERPLEFVPERFENKNIDPYGQYIELIPGGAGRRMCPALVLGMTMFQLTLGNLVHGFHWKIAPPFPPETLGMSEAFGLTIPRKEPLSLIATPRLPSQLYTNYY